MKENGGYIELEVGDRFPYGEGKFSVEVVAIESDDRPPARGFLKVKTHFKNHPDDEWGIMWLNPEMPFVPSGDGTKKPAILPSGHGYEPPSIDSQRPF